MKKLLLSMLSVCFVFAFAKAQSQKGYYNFTYNEDKGSIDLEVSQLDTEFLYVHSLTTGLGSNDIGLDRGQLGDGVVVKWMKSGNKLLLVQPNLSYRATGDNVQERKSVEQAFARSVLYGFTIKETKGTTYTIDLTPFLLEDAHGIVERLKARKEGTYKIDATRSVLWMENTKSFPKNTEFEAMLTFTGTPTGRNVRSVAPDPTAITVIQHHSFVELPEKGYEPRVFHPQSGSFYTSYMDYSAPVDEDITKRFITRHRLDKKDPTAAISEAVEPIIYYLDPGTPEPVRTALLEGAAWWNNAFTSSGFKNAFQVKMLPEGADPMDLRYNVIQWVHRSTRGWSYGGSVIDPRTGEILKGHVSLGSLRIRQDFMIAQGLLKEPFKSSDTNSSAMLDMALARIRQLSAHELGHTLGFAHNFAASASDRASVMDYPHPYVKLVDGSIDLSDAYATGIATWDKLIVQYSYGAPVEPKKEKEYLNETLERMKASGIAFITDSDARDASGSHATAHLWDNGTNAAVELERVLAVRKVAMNQFSKYNVKSTDPLSVLEDVFVPVYLSHRYQTEAAVKNIAGLNYNYSSRDEAPYTFVGKTDQLAALNAVLETVAVEQLVIPQQVVSLFPPRAYGYSRDRESFKSNAGAGFDPMYAAATSVEMTFNFLINPERLNAVAINHALDNSNLSINELLERTKEKVFVEASKSVYEKSLAATVQERFINALINAHKNDKTQIHVRAAILETLTELQKNLKRDREASSKQLHKMLTDYLTNPQEYNSLPALDIPDGSPIGCGL